MLNSSTTKTVGALVMGAAAVLATNPVAADDYHHHGLVEVTVTNLTRGQVISPMLLASHNRRLAPLFVLGEEASPALAKVAEDADFEMLAMQWEPAVFDLAKIVFDGGAIPPGESGSAVIRAPRWIRHITLVGMLVSTNDAFTSLRAGIPGSGSTTVRTIAYDAGSEANNEDCDFIPGPPCGNPGVRDTDDAEGFVHVHAGVHGIAMGRKNLDPAMHDWRNPVAEIRIRRIRHRD